MPAHPLAPARADMIAQRSRALRLLGAACCTYLLIAAGVVLAWLVHGGVTWSLWLIGAAALAPLAGLALLWRDTRDARTYLANMLAATLALPLLLLFWASSFDLSAAPPPALPTLDAQRLFVGASFVQDTNLRQAGISLSRSGSFADGSELRLTRFADADAAAHYLATLGQALRGQPFGDAGRRGLRLQGGGMPGSLILLEQHGADLLELRARDVAGGLARLALQQVPLPHAGPVTPRESPTRWPFFAAAGLGHALAFLGLIAWGGALTTRVPAMRGMQAAMADELRARLQSLAQPGGPFVVSRSGPLGLCVDVPVGTRRTHRITLALDVARQRVCVQEKLGAHGAPPRDADEASLRHSGEPGFDPARPAAQKVWSATRQTTLIEPARLRAVPLQLRLRQAVLPPAYAAGLDGEGVLTALCALVTRSGWDWQPRLFGRVG